MLQAQDEDGLYYYLVQGNKIIAKGLTKDQPNSVVNTVSTISTPFAVLVVNCPLRRSPCMYVTNLLVTSSSRTTSSGRSMSGAQSSGSRRQEPLRLTDREKDELRAAGKCFVCRETGHMSRNCPRNSQVRSDSKGKPPGVSAFSMDIGGLDTEDLRALSVSTAHVEEIPFNAFENTGKVTIGTSTEKKR